MSIGKIEMRKTQRAFLPSSPLKPRARKSGSSARSSRPRRGGAFTLIELLIVVAIIGILAGIAVPNFLQAMVRSKIAAAQAQINACATALESYHVDRGGFPPTRYYCLAFGAEQAKKYFELPWELTTPVAYLADRPLDPFNTFPGASSDAPGQTIKYRHPGFGYFNGMPTEEGMWVPKSFPLDDGDYVFYNNASTEHPARDCPVQYGLWSAGPIPKVDIGMHTYEPVPSHTWYNPSNGTVSSGIIVHLSTGHHSP
ncbi:MAG: prepilin-type N-terminal cleavage/methylation domain-containing protein [Candidatus Omnitrophica bacterium]|nr:prepilin-type N-terminal cleavage/methylation domain-containing protein [Candidatus Omnitrophota bacterium]